MLKRTLPVFSLAIIGVLCFSSAAMAQGGNQGNTGGNTGGTNTGGGQTDTGTASGGVSGDINQQFQQTTQTGLQDNLTAAEGFFTDTRTEDGFVGASTENQTGVFARAGEIDGGGVRTLDILRALGNLNQQAGEVRTTSSRRMLRAPLRLGFTVTKPDAEVVASTFENRLLQLPVYQEHASVVATLENRTLTLTGTVQTQQERIMVERLALLEPGVYRVNNQLSVVSAEQ